MSLALALSLVLAFQDPPEGRPLAGQDAGSAGAIFSQVYRNWKLSCEIPGIRDVRIAFDVTIDANGAIVGRPVPVQPQDSLVYRAAADGARRALLDSAPFEVPEGYRGGVFRPTFIVARACARPDED